MSENSARRRHGRKKPPAERAAVAERATDGADERSPEQLAVRPGSEKRTDDRKERRRRQVTREMVLRGLATIASSDGAGYLNEQDMRRVSDMHARLSESTEPEILDVVRAAYFQLIDKLEAASKSHPLAPSGFVPIIDPARVPQPVRSTLPLDLVGSSEPADDDRVPLSEVHSIIGVEPGTVYILRTRRILRAPDKDGGYSRRWLMRWAAQEGYLDGPAGMPRTQLSQAA